MAFLVIFENVLFFSQVRIFGYLWKVFLSKTRKEGQKQYGECLVVGNCIILNTNLQEKGNYVQVWLQRLDTLWLSDPFCVRNFWKKKTFTFNRL